MDEAQVAIRDAEFLLKGEGSSQAVVNRAYYAMFYSVLALLQQLGKVPSKHKGVVSLFDMEFVRTGLFPKQLSRDYHRIFKLRHVSDYKALKPVPRPEAEEVLAKARSFVQAVTEYFQKSLPAKDG